MGDIVKIQTGGVTSPSGSVTARLKHAFSRQHLFSAEIFAADARRIETDKAGAGQEDLQRHRACVTSSILSAVAFLESSINELYHEAESRDQTALSGLRLETLALLAEFWPEMERASILQKHQIALLVGRVERFEPGRKPYQDVESLIKLRDALVHYRPEWDDERGRHQNLQARLRGEFTPNPMVPQGSLWFPHLCLGAACAEWGVAIAGRFSDEFCDRLGIPRRHG